MNRAQLFRLVRGGQGTPPEPPAEVQYALPGAGFGGVPTDTPEAAGAPGEVGYTTEAVMRWDTVPNQDVTGEIFVGLCADHMPTNAEKALGLAHNVLGVRYIVAGGEEVYEPRERVNPYTQAKSFYIGLRANDFVDGRVELRAIPILSNGQHYVMQGDDVTAPFHSLFLNMNAGGGLFTATRYVDKANGSDTLNDGLTYATPFKTMSKARASIFTASGNVGVGGGRVILRAGTGYGLGDATENFERSATDRWFYIEAAEGEEVVFDNLFSTASDYAGINVNRVAIRGCKFTGDQRLQGKTAQWLWIDQFEFVGEGQQIAGTRGGKLIGDGAFASYWATNGTYTDARNGLRSSQLLLNVNFERIGEDAITGFNAAINVRSAEQDRGAANSGGAGAWHPDFAAFNTPKAGVSDNTQRNRYMQNCSGVDIAAEIIFADPRPTEGDPASAADIDGFACVDCTFERRSGTVWTAWVLARPQRNVHVRGLTLTGGGQMAFGHDTASYDEVVFDDCYCDGTVNGLDIKPGIVVRGGNLS